jgi:phosphohistidine phosphatase
MLIYLLRHGIAAVLGQDNHFSDAERALTPEGLTKMRAASLGLKRLGVTFDLVVSSPLVRAKETAEIVVEVLKIKEPIQEWDELAPDGSIDGLMRQLQKHRDKTAVLLVGHQPFMGLLACFLIFGSDKVSLALKKGGICCIQVNEVPPQFAGELLWMLPPKILRTLGEK